MDCQDVRERLNAFLDRETEAAENRRIQEHLSICLGCQEELRDLQRLNAFLNEFASDPLPAGLDRRVLDSLPGFPRKWGFMPKLAVAASCAFMLLSGFLLGKSYISSLNTSSPIEFGQESLYSYFEGGSR